MSHRRSNRRGYVMVLFAMLLFGIMAMAALVIDIGFARLAQRQMQTAADSAALEGLRGSGLLSYEDCQDNSEQFVAWHFDNDLDAANGDNGAFGTGGSFGAGPLVEFSGGAGDPALAASQTMSVDPDNTAYKPILIRQDETPGDFTVELRRGATNNATGNLFSSGPPIPYLFARGSLINRELVVNGITVRATGTARALPAVRVGLPIVDPMTGNELALGAIPIAYELTDWQANADSPEAIAMPAQQIGEEVTIVGPGNASLTGYCTIYLAINGTNRVVGFGWIRNGLSADSFDDVAIHNATARLSEAWQALSLLSEPDRIQVRDTNMNLTRALRASLQSRIE